MVTTANTPALRRSLLGAETAPLRAPHASTPRPANARTASADQPTTRVGQARRDRLKALRNAVRAALDD